MSLFPCIKTKIATSQRTDRMKYLVKRKTADRKESFLTGITGLRSIPLKFSNNYAGL